MPVRSLSLLLIPTLLSLPTPAAGQATRPPSGPTSMPANNPNLAARSPAPKFQPAKGFWAFPDFARRRKGSLASSLHWNPKWPKFGLTGWIVSGVFGATALTVAIIGPVGKTWTGGIVADEATRDALRADSLHSRRTLRDVSDALLTTSVSYSLFDALLVAGWLRRSPEVAKQMALIDIEVFAVTQGVLGLVKSLANRERPYGRNCGGERPAATRDCDSDDRFYSFPSGHAGHTFAAAAANCTHHLYLQLYGSGWGDALACTAGFALAAGTSTLRMVGDQHYLSDVMVGASIGTLVGFGVPWFFHYRHGKATDPNKRDGAVDLKLLPAPFGAVAVGRF